MPRPKEKPLVFDKKIGRPKMKKEDVPFGSIYKGKPCIYGHGKKRGFAMRYWHTKTCRECELDRKAGFHPSDRTGYPAVGIPDAEELSRIETMAGMGLTVEQICLIQGWDPSTLYHERYKKRWEIIRAARDRGLSKAALAIGNSLYQKALSGDMAAIRWWEATRLGLSPDNHRMKELDPGQTLELDLNDREALPDHVLMGILEGHNVLPGPEPIDGDFDEIDED